MSTVRGQGSSRWSPQKLSVKYERVVTSSGQGRSRRPRSIAGACDTSTEAWEPPTGDRTEFGDDAVRAVWGDQEVCSYETADPKVLARWRMVDGIALDAAGNVWVTTLMPSAIWAITPDHHVVTVAAICSAGREPGSAGGDGAGEIARLRLVEG